MKSLCVFAFLALMLNCNFLANAVTIEMAPVGNLSNLADVEVMSDGTNGYGSVSYQFNIGKYEISNAQYVEFLSQVAVADPYELYDPLMETDSRGGITRSGPIGAYTYSVKDDAIGEGPAGSNYIYSNKPVVFVSWYDSLRFTNWLHNGQGDGDTETGAYNLLGGTATPSNWLSISRNPIAKWFLPSEDEWYKAAYHKNDGTSGNYWDYPTSSDTVPDNNLPSSDSGNSANSFDASGYSTGDSSYPMTDVGAYSLSASPYGTFDQAGNVFEWNESFRVFPDPPGGGDAGIRGGSWTGLSDRLASQSRQFGVLSGSSIFGFRVASKGVPEPSALTLWLIASLAGTMFKRVNR